MSNGGDNEEDVIVEGEGEEEEKKPSDIQNAAKAYAELLDHPPKRKFNLSYFSERRKYYIERRKALDELIKVLRKQDDKIFDPFHIEYKYNKKALNPSDFAKLSRFEKLKISLLRFSSKEDKKIHRLLSDKTKEDALLKKAKYIAGKKKEGSKEKEAAKDISNILEELRDAGKIVHLGTAAAIACARYENKEKSANADIKEYQQSILNLCVRSIRKKVEDEMIISRRIKKSRNEDFKLLGKDFIELQEICSSLIEYTNKKYPSGKKFFSDEIKQIKEKTPPGGKYQEVSAINDESVGVGDFFYLYGTAAPNPKKQNRDHYAIAVVENYFKSETAVPGLNSISDTISSLSNLMTLIYRAPFRIESMGTEEEKKDTANIIFPGIDEMLPDVKNILKKALADSTFSEEEKKNLLKKFEKFEGKYAAFRRKYIDEPPKPLITPARDTHNTSRRSSQSPPDPSRRSRSTPKPDPFSRN